MAIIGADGLSVLIGDGATPTEVFNVLKGAAITRLEISQKNNPNPAIASDAWQVNVGASARKAVIDCDAYASDDAAAMRLRSLALSGASGNFKVKLSAMETLSVTAMVTVYREIIGAGDVKKIQFRLESSGAGSIA